MAFCRDGVFLAQQQLRQHRYCQKSHQVGNEQRSGNGNRQGLEKRPGHARKKGEGEKNDQSRRRGTGQRHGHFLGKVQDRPFFLLFDNAPHQVLEHHHYIVYHQPYRRGHAAQGHDIEALVQHQKNQGAGDQHAGQGDGNDQRQAQIAQKGKEHQGGEEGANEDGIAYAPGGGGDELALVIPSADPYPCRHAGCILPQQAAQGGVDGHGIAAGLLQDIEKDGVVAVGSHRRPLRAGTLADFGNVGQVDDAVGTGFEDGLADFLRSCQATAAQDLIEAVVPLAAADGLDAVGAGQGVLDIAKAQAVVLQTPGVDAHCKLLFRAALYRDLCNTGNAEQARPQVVEGIAAQGNGIEGRRSQRQSQNGVDGRIHTPGAKAGTARQLGELLIDGGLDLQQGGAHVAAPGKLQGDIGGTARRRRADLAYSRHPA